MGIWALRRTSRLYYNRLARFLDRLLTARQLAGAAENGRRRKRLRHYINNIRQCGSFSRASGNRRTRRG